MLEEIAKCKDKEIFRNIRKDDSPYDDLVIAEINQLAIVALHRLKEDNIELTNNDLCCYSYERSNNGLAKLTVMDAIKDCEYHFEHYRATNDVICSYLEPTDEMESSINYGIYKTGVVAFV
jgi:hypothetical protein